MASGPSSTLGSMRPGVGGSLASLETLSIRRGADLIARTVVLGFAWSRTHARRAS